jgi:lysozyme family protein
MSQTRSDLIVAKDVLIRRRASTVDAAEKASLTDAIGELNDAIEAVDAGALLQAAGVVARATDVLEGVIASARMGPFDSFLGDVQKSMSDLAAHLDSMQASERLSPAPLAAAAAAAPAAGGRASVVAPSPAPSATPSAPPPPAPAAASPGGGIPTPINSHKFNDLRDEYGDFFNRCALRPEFAANVEFYVSRLIKFKPTYAALTAELGIPWVFIGIVHGMEGGFNFNTHLHNGDPLSARTVRVPAGRPADGQPPFTWLESARDALKLKKLDQVADWTLPRILYQLEAYNGFGYRPRGIPTPYLWSFSNLYRAGKFVADGVFDPAAVSNQCGAAVMLRTLQERGVV